MTAVLLRCTAKFGKFLGEPRLQNVDTGDDTSEWYGNLLWFDGRKCLLFTEANTVFSFLVPDVRKAEVSPIGPMLVDHIRFQLVTEELPASTFGALEPSGVTLAKTASRSVLGCMNEFAFHAEVTIKHGGGLESVNITELNQRLRRIPIGGKHRGFPIDMARQVATKAR